MRSDLHLSASEDTMRRTAEPAEECLNAAKRMRLEPEVFESTVKWRVGAELLCTRRMKIMERHTLANCITIARALPLAYDAAGQ